MSWDTLLIQPVIKAWNTIWIHRFVSTIPWPPRVKGKHLNSYLGKGKLEKSLFTLSTRRSTQGSKNNHSFGALKIASFLMSAKYQENTFWWPMWWLTILVTLWLFPSSEPMALLASEEGERWRPDRALD